MSEKQQTYSLEKILQHTPAGVALAGVIAIVLSYVYQASYFSGRGVDAMDNVSVSDLADRAGVSVTVAVLILCVLFVAHKIGLREAAKTDWEQHRKKPDWARNTFTWVAGFMALMLIYGAYRSSWERMAVIICIFQTLTFILFFLQDRGFFLFLGFRSTTLQLVVIAVIGLPALVGAGTGAIARNCPATVNLSTSNDGAIHGDLVANLNRGVVFIEFGTGSVAVIPWSQITRYSEKVCVPKH